MQERSPTKIKITDAVVAQAALPAGRDDLTLWDTEARGFGLRIRPTVKTWVLCYRPLGAGRSTPMKRLKLGTTGTIPKTADARRLAFQFLGDVARGKDPAAERAEAKRREKARVGDLLDRYERHLTKRKYVARKMVMSLLRTRLAGHADRDVRDLKGSHLAAISERLEGQGLDGAADAFRARCRAFLNWCVTTAKALDENPSFGHRRERPTRADRLKTENKARALTDAELAKVWAAADTATLFGRLLRFLILTGCRRGEGAQLRRSWLARDQRGRRVLVLPADIVKQGRAHVVPVTPKLNRVLAQCTIDSRSDLFFASERTGQVISGWTKFVDEIERKSGIEFSLHDLRRTVRTGMSALGVPTDIAELCIGHSRPGLEKVYNHDAAERARREAFLRWHRHVHAITATDRIAEALALRTAAE